MNDAMTADQYLQSMGIESAQEGRPTYAPGFRIGSQDEDGAHRADVSGWPYSIYRLSQTIGSCDAVLCDGIQNIDDARQLLALCNGEIRPALANRVQMFAWE